VTASQTNTVNTTAEKSEVVRTSSANVNAENPWPGLEAYDEASSEFFFGRKDESEQLLALIQRASLTVVYGKSGLGKTSLLQAGLFPLLRKQHFLPVLKRLDFSQAMKCPPLEQMKQELGLSLERVNAEFPPMDDNESLWEYLHRKGLEFWSPDNFQVTPVLVFDQFEELFSRSGGGPDAIQQVCNALADLIENRIPPEFTKETKEERKKRTQLDLLSQRYKIVLSFREDFLPDIRAWEKRVPSLLKNDLRLQAMSRESAIEAVELAGKSVLVPGSAPDIVDLVGKRESESGAAETTEMVIEPVLLSLCCTQLNLRRELGRLIDADLVKKAGQDILESFYQDALKDKEVCGEPDVATFIEDKLIVGDRYRGDYPKQGALDEGIISDKQLTALTDRLRLLRIVYRGDTPRIELIHDRMVPVVRKARDERLLQEQHREEQRKAQQAQAEWEKEKARNKELQRERDVARRWRDIATAVAFITLALLAGFWYEKQARDQAKMSREIAVQTSQLAEGRLALKIGSEPLEQTMFRALATYRLSTKNRELAEARDASLSALELALDTSGHLAKVLRLKGVTPTPGLAYSPNGKMLAVGSEDGLIQLIDASSYYPAADQLDCKNPAKNESVWALAFNKDGTRLAAGYISNDDGNGLVCVFDVEQRTVVQKWSNTDHGRKNADVLSLAYGGKPGAEFVFFGGTDGKLRKLDVQSGSVVGADNESDVVAIALDPKETLVATGGRDAKIRLWNLAEFGDQAKQAVPPMVGHGATIEQMVFSPADPKLLVSAADDGRIMTWNVDKGCRTLQSEAQEAKIYGIAITPKATLLAAAGTDGYVRLFSLPQELTACDDSVAAKKSITSGKIEVINDGVLSGHGGMVLAVAFDPQGDHLASTGQDGSIRIWMRNTGSFSLAKLGLDAANGASVKTLAISPDGKVIAGGDYKGQISLWERPGELGEPGVQDPIALWKVSDRPIRSLIFTGSGDQNKILSGGDDGVVRQWDPNKKKMIGNEMADNALPVYSMAISPDGNTLAAGSQDGTVRLWNLANGTLTNKIDPPANAPDYQLSAVGFSNDGKYLAIGSSRYDNLRVVDLNTKKDRGLQGHSMGVASISHNDSEWLLSAGKDGSVLEWKEKVFSETPSSGIRKHDDFEYRTGAPGLRHPQPLTAMDSSKDGRVVLTGGQKGEIQLWDGTEHVLISDQFGGHEGRIDAVAVNRDGSYFVTADSGEILVWPGPDRWADIVCSKLVWNMSRDQWNRWVSSSIPYAAQCPGLAKEPHDVSQANR
jgi:WD40 repeat protein